MICNEQAKVIWLTGLSGSGKSTIAKGLKDMMLQCGEPVCILDGDVIRNLLNRDLGYDDYSRSENIRRAVEVAKILHEANINVIAAFISPFQKDRELARARFNKHSFIEVYISTPLDVCERRDVKGLYRQARSGKVKNMTGIDSIYEPPINPEITIDTSKQSIKSSISLLNKFAKEYCKKLK